MPRNERIANSRSESQGRHNLNTEPQSSSSESTDKAIRAWRLSKWITIAWAAVLPLLVYGTSQITFGTAAISQWLPQGGEEREKYSQFLNWFDNDLYLIVSWSGCRLNDPRLPQLAEALRAEVEQGNDGGVVRNIETTIDLMHRLVDGPAAMTPRQAANQLRGILIGDDGTCALLIQLSQAGEQRENIVVDIVSRVALDSAGLERTELKFGGSAYEAVFIDAMSARSLKTFVVPSFVAAMLMAWICMGSLRLTLVVFTIAGMGQFLGLSMLYLGGGQLNAVLIVLPTLLFMLTVSAAVHLVNYYRDAGLDSGVLAGVKAVQTGWIPCVLATATTVIGLLSLCVSNLQPVREFGFYAALGLIGSTTVLLTTFPFLASLRWASDRQTLTARPSVLRRAGGNAMDAILDHAGLTTFICLVGLSVAAFGLRNLQSTVRVENMFEADSEILQNYEWLEQHVGPLVSVELICSFDAHCELNDFQRVTLIEQFHATAATVSNVGGVFSAATFLPRIPQGGGLLSAARRAVYRKKLPEYKQQLIKNGAVAVSSAGEHWRVSSKVPAIHSLGYGQQRDAIKNACEPKITEAEQIPGVHVDFTGLSPVFDEAQHLLLSDLVRSFLMAFVLICPIMMIVLRGALAGGLAMLPNIAPVVLVCGIMGWLQIPFDIASVLTVSVALGIAVDDTLHFVTWFSRAKHSGSMNRQAVQHAVGKCATAMFQTTIICCCTMLVFLPTEFLPTRKFAILMSLMLAVAIIGDLVLLPAILASRLGRQISSDKSRI